MLGWLLVALAVAPAALTAQSDQALRAAQNAAAAADVRGIMVEDSLPPAKRQLRDELTLLRDTLTRVSALDARISRSEASGMSAVVMSSARQLWTACRSGAGTANRTLDQLSNLQTNDPRGDNALSTYRGALGDLLSDMRSCQQQDSIALGAKPIDARRVQDISAAAAAAILRHDQVRDALVGMLGIRMPVKGYIPRARPLH
jgi:hypothetical protein